MITNTENGQVVRDDLSWKKFGNCIVQPQFEKQTNGGTKWLVECQCPAKTRWWAWAEIIKRSPGLCCKSCRNEIVRKARTTHGGRYKKSYHVHKGMMERCYYEKHKAYPVYGGAGIKVCERWHKYENFVADMGEPPENKTIDRYPNIKGNYEPGNCQWSTKREQAEHRCTNKFLTVGDRTQTYSAWARETGLDKSTIRKRALKDWPPEKCISKDDFRC